MAHTKKTTKTKTVVKKKPVVRKAAVAPVASYGEYALPLVITWLALITVFIGLILVKLY